MNKHIEHLKAQRLADEEWQEHQRKRAERKARLYPVQSWAQKAQVPKDQVKPAEKNKPGECGWLRRSFSNRQMRRVAKARDRAA